MDPIGQIHDAQITLTDAFRARYSALESSTGAILHSGLSDPAVIARAGDKLDEYAVQFQQVSYPPSLT